MKTEEGFVVEGEGDIVKIKAGRHNDCKNCGACPGNDSIILEAKNPIGAKPGQRIEFELKEENSLKAAFIVFMVPLIAIFIGAFVGGKIAKNVGGSLLFCQIIGAITIFILAVIYIKFFDRKTKNDQKNLPVIVKVIR